MYACVQIVSEVRGDADSRDNSDKKLKIRWFLLWGIIITLAVYDVPSNLYWIFLLYVGTLILVRGNIKTMLKMTAFSCLGGIMTCLLYLPIWLTIADESGYVNEGLVDRIVFGVKRMLSNKFIQSISREEMITDFWKWINDVGNMISFGQGIVPLIIVLVASVFSIIFCLRNRKADKSIDTKFIILFLSIFSFFGVFILTLIQSSLPYSRVLCFLGVDFVFIISTAFYIARRNAEALKSKVALVFLAVCIVLCMNGFILR